MSILGLIRRFFSDTSFNHKIAQYYEGVAGIETIKANFERTFRNYEKAKNKGELWQSENDLWFQGDIQLWQGFVEYVKERICVEIGAGPFGYLSPCYWIKNRIIIDPLVHHYRNYQIKKFGKTFFSSEIETYSQSAEIFVEKYRSKVNGCIICQNTLDHTDDPLLILNVISDYATDGCYLLLWTDIWHLAGLDRCHRNITKSRTAMKKILNGFGFEIIRIAKSIRDPNKYVEYGCIARYGQRG